MHEISFTIRICFNGAYHYAKHSSLEQFQDILNHLLILMKFTTSLHVHNTLNFSLKHI